MGKQVVLIDYNDDKTKFAQCIVNRCLANVKYFILTLGNKLEISYILMM